MNKISLNGWMFIKTFLLFFMAVVGYIYISFFEVNLVSGDWLSVDGFARIIIPDTLLYLVIIDSDNVLTSILFSGVKNTLVPSLLWAASGFDWYIVFIINIVIVCFIAYYMQHLAGQYQIPRNSTQLAIVIILLLPTTIYYTVGALKELPMALLMLASLYYYNLKKFKVAFVMITLFVMVRYQLVVVVVLLFIFGYSRKTLRWAVIVMFSLAAIYPMLSNIDMLSASSTEVFRDEYGVHGSIGGQVEAIRSNVYLISAFAVAVRVFQSLFEPLFGFVKDFTFYENGDLSVYKVVHFFSTIMVLPYIYLFVRKLKFIVFTKVKIRKDVQTIFASLFISFILVGGFSFIHGRYLIPFFPLMLIAGLIPIKRMQEFNSMASNSWSAK
jgi:hypothetical protein